MFTFLKHYARIKYKKSEKPRGVALFICNREGQKVKSPHMSLVKVARVVDF